jgi:hypothetical protein
VWPERGRCPEWLAGGNATAGHHSGSGPRAWHQGSLILAAGRGSVPAPAVMAGGTAVAGIPAVAARDGTRSYR